MFCCCDLLSPFKGSSYSVLLAADVAAYLLTKSANESDLFNDRYQIATVALAFLLHGEKLSASVVFK